MKVNVKFRVCKFSDERKIVMIPKCVSSEFEIGEFVDIIKLRKLSKKRERNETK